MMLQQLQHIHCGHARRGDCHAAAFTFFNVLTPLISVALGFPGIRMLKAPSPESNSKS
jgi:hypothetical protein